MPEIGILIIDDDVATQEALHLMLDSEGWRVSVARDASTALSELARGPWRLVIANAALTGVDTTLFATLVELGRAEIGGPTLLRVLFLVPENPPADVQKTLDLVRAPYALKPVHLHDFLDKISDLLMDTGAIATPIRRVQGDLRLPETPVLRDSQRERGKGKGGRQTTMFAGREEYMMSEEELLEFERQEEEQRKKKKKANDFNDLSDL